MTEHAVRNPQDALDLLDFGLVEVELLDDVMSFPLILDAVGQPALPPGGDLLDLASIRLDQLADLIVLHASRRRLRQLIASLADDARRGLVIDSQLHQGAAIDRLELDLAVVLVAGDRPPRDHLVGLLLDDLGLPAAIDAGDLRFPFQVLVVELANFVDVFHELWEFLKLCPLRIDLIVWLLNLNRLFDLRHAASTLPWLGGYGSPSYTTHA